MNTHHLAQINIGRFRLPQEHSANRDFMEALDHVNALAEASPGFVWRLTGDGNNAVDLRPYPDPQMAINMSVWTDLDALTAFAYRNADHRAIMRRRREWFEHMDFYMALWWVPVGDIPTIEEGKAKIDLIARLGPTAEAFTFKQPFPAPGQTKIDPVLDECA